MKKWIGKRYVLWQDKPGIFVKDFKRTWKEYWVSSSLNFFGLMLPFGVSYRFDDNVRKWKLLRMQMILTIEMQMTHVQWNAIFFSPFFPYG